MMKENEISGDAPGIEESFEAESLLDNDMTMDIDEGDEELELDEEVETLNTCFIPPPVNTDSEAELLLMPLMSSNTDEPTAPTSEPPTSNTSIRSRKQNKKVTTKRKRRRRRVNSSSSSESEQRRWCPAPFVRSTLSVMNFLARILFWSSVVAMVAAVVWYSYELKNNG